MKNVVSRAAIRNIALKSLVVVAAFGAASSAQAATANINASATIIPPITLTQPVDVRFGNLAGGTVAGTIVMAVPAAIPALAAVPTTAAPTNNSTRVATGAVAVGGTCSVTVLCGVGSFQINGQASTSFATVTVPATVTLAGPGPGMILTTTRRYGAPGGAGVTTGAGTTGTTGLAVLYVGGSLAVGTSALQTSGAYTVAMPITVDY